MSGSVVCPSHMEEVENYAGEVICRIARSGHEVCQVPGPCAGCGKDGWNDHNKGSEWFCGPDCKANAKRTRLLAVSR